VAQAIRVPAEQAWDPELKNPGAAEKQNNHQCLGRGSRDLLLISMGLLFGVWKCSKIRYGLEFMQIQPKSFSNVIDSILEINIFLFFFLMVVVLGVELR
jgi:hypothetical protein